MSLDATTRERTCGWVLASGIAAAAIGLFLAAIVLGGARASGAASSESGTPECVQPSPPHAL